MRSTEIGQAFRTIQNMRAAGGKKHDGQSALARALRVSIGAGGRTRRRNRIAASHLAP